MCVVGHDDGHVQFVLASMVVETTREDNVTCYRRQNPTEFSNESDEVGREVFLQVRQIAAVELICKSWHD